ncbi:MAG: dihydrofolate reductase [Oscillospiraceae bacterium]|nr:dihydrofolate reductase [Oscillospiraceae bacterium]
MKLTAIAAVTQNWGIGLNGQLLVHIPEDLRRFRALTTGGTLVMGRRTLDSLPGGRPLPDRTTVVLTRNPAFSRPGVLTANNVEALLELLPGLPEPYHVAGGAEIYRLLLPYCREALLTQVEIDPEADVFFPQLEQLPGWTLAERSEPHEFQGLSYSFCRWEHIYI